MSANNFILIKRNLKESAYSVQDCDAETGSENEFIGSFKELDEAFNEANKYMQDNEVEYGIKLDK